MEIKAAVNSLVEKLLTRGVDPERAQKKVEQELAEASSSTGGSDWAKRIAATSLMEHYARRAAVKSFVTGFPGGLVAIPMAFLDAQGSLSSRAELALALQMLIDDEHKIEDDWRDQVIRAAYDMDEDQVTAARPIALRILRDVLLERGVRMVGKRVGQRVIPILGGVIGAGFTYGWMHREGRRLFERLREEENDDNVIRTTGVEVHA